jgi:hypothetical protein
MGAASSGPARGRGVFHVKHCAKDPGGEAAWFDERAWPPGAEAARIEHLATTDPQSYPQSRSCQDRADTSGRNCGQASSRGRGPRGTKHLKTK